MCFPSPGIPSEWRPVARLAAVTRAKSQTSHSPAKTVSHNASSCKCKIMFIASQSCDEAVLSILADLLATSAGPELAVELYLHIHRVGSKRG